MNRPPAFTPAPAGAAPKGFAYTAKSWLYLQATDCVAKDGVIEFETWKPHTWESGEATRLAQFKHYDAIDFWVATGFCRTIHKELAPCFDCFASSVDEFVFVSDVGSARLLKEQPDIARAVIGDSP